MQYEISNEDALIFARKFYQQIGQGMPIDEAVTEARKELGTPRRDRDAWDARSFGTPVVYLQTSGAIILPSEKKGIGKEDLPEIKTCPKCLKRIPSDYKRCVHPGCICVFMKCPKCGRLLCEDFGNCPVCGHDWSRRGAESGTMKSERLPLIESLPTDSIIAESGTGKFERLPPDRIPQASGIFGEVIGHKKKEESG
jgi:hypothetical protein